MIEVFEWRDREAIDEAHNNAVTKASWEKLMGCSTLVPLASLGESSYVLWSGMIVLVGVCGVATAKPTNQPHTQPNTTQLNSTQHKNPKHNTKTSGNTTRTSR